MLFNSIHFLVFFGVVATLYYALKHKYRWILLLIASLYFYMSWKAEYVVLIVFSIFVCYLSARYIQDGKNQKLRKFFLVLSLVVNFGILFAFKYFNFFSLSISQFLQKYSIQFSPIMLKILLPVGISFYTFQALSYVVDVYRKQMKAEKHFGIFALYITYFPQLVAGPIERSGNLLPQFKEKHCFNFRNTIDGLQLMAWGFFEKVVIADRLAKVVDMIYGDVTYYTGIPLILATVFFAFQIFCDFSGYCNIATGAAKIMGINLMENFRRPYLSKSITEFWKRWHISLSTWFKDYLYFPLGGNRVSKPRWMFNIFLVFLVSGIWHGANYTFMLWGVLHGFYMIISAVSVNAREKITGWIGLKKITKIHSSLKIIITFILVDIGWVFFRANNIHDVIYIFTHLFPIALKFHGINIGLDWTDLIIAICSIVVLMTVHIVQEYYDTKKFFEKHLWIKWIIYIILILCILLFGVFKNRAFIYFQF